MANIYPFKGFRYDKSLVKDISRVVTQPYDKIPEKLKKEYLERHPANVVRIIRNTDYLEAASLWHRWIQNGILAQDGKPCLYIYRQNCTIEAVEMVRTGFIGMVSLDDDDLVVKGHETILDKPLEDRLKMIRATEANEGLIFTLFSDKKLEADHILDSIADATAPVIDIVDDFEVRNRLWCLNDPARIQQIAALLKGKPLYIADGHHRFQTSVLYHRECVEKGWTPGAEESFDKRMIALFNMESPGLRILATHRAVRNVPEPVRREFLDKARKHFTVSELDSLDRLEKEMASEVRSFGLVTGKKPEFHLLVLKEGAVDDPGFMPGVDGAVRGLGVTILHEAILAGMLGIGKEMVTSGEYVDYFRGSANLVENIKSGASQMGFLLRPTTLEQVRDISEAGEKMPQKSTDFFPKLLTGLVMMKMEIEK